MALFIWSDGDGLFIPCHLVLYLPQLTVTLACCCVLGCLVTFISLELHSTLKYLKKEIYLRQPDRKVPEIDGIWNLLRFPICSSLKLIKHSLLAGVTPFFIIRILAAKNISIYSPVYALCGYHFGPVLRWILGRITTPHFTSVVVGVGIGCTAPL